MAVFAYLIVAVLLLWTAILLAFSRPLIARWREPVLRKPVLIIESDDWGAGPLAQAEALERLHTLLQGVRDGVGHSAVMTLGIILEVPDGARIAACNVADYHALGLADQRFDAVRKAIQAGVAAGVFAPQLHGQCHYWPAAVLEAAQSNDRVREWLTHSEPAATEDLPSALQSRWINGATLPSLPLTQAAIEAAVDQEVAAYRSVIGVAPQVAVATTFVWNEWVEAAWSQSGVEVVITPGQRATCRNAAGKPACEDSSMLSGERSRSGQTYLVRDVYFEPALGHETERLLAGLATRTRLGRACMVETHRFNFLQNLDASLATLESALLAARDAHPDLRFISSLELSRVLNSRDPDWIETCLRRRLGVWHARLAEIPRFGRVARASGLALPLVWMRLTG